MIKALKLTTLLIVVAFFVSVVAARAEAQVSPRRCNTIAEHAPAQKKSANFAMKTTFASKPAPPAILDPTQIQKDFTMNALTASPPT